MSQSDSPKAPSSWLDPEMPQDPSQHSVQSTLSQKQCGLALYGKAKRAVMIFRALRKVIPNTLTMDSSSLNLLMKTLSDMSPVTKKYPDAKPVGFQGCTLVDGGEGPERIEVSRQ